MRATKQKKKKKTKKTHDPFCSCSIYDNLDQQPIGKNRVVFIETHGIEMNDEKKKHI